PVTPHIHDGSMTFTYVSAADPRREADCAFSVTLSSGRTIDVTDADTYQPEGPLTTFFRTGSSSPTIDVWSERVASFRTADIVAIHQQTHQRPVHPSAQNLDPRLPATETSGERRPFLSVVSA
ncbi:MAG: hypothetical protein KJN63_12040, partial [Acidimicrobiia bacterium]|nr:hypothetical protein [Acidimicrobiia bacterium]